MADAVPPAPLARGLWRNAVLAVGQVVVTGAVLLLVYRFLLASLGAVEVGIWATVFATSSAARVSELGFAGSATRFVAGARDADDAATVVQTTVLTVGALLAAISLVAYWPISLVLARSIPHGHVLPALAILPYALASVWLNGVGSAIQSSLDGSHRADLRSALTMAASVVHLGLVHVLAPQHGLIGLGLAQILHGAFIVVAGWLVLRREIRTLPLVPLRWSVACFRLMFRYGLSFQLISLSGVLSDPIARLAVARFGGLGAAAFFDIAQKVVLQVRTLIVAANQVLVPRIAALHGAGDAQRVGELYSQSYRAVFFLAAPIFAMLVGGLPLLSVVSIGQVNGDFVLFGTLMVCAYFVNAISAPAYFLNLGIGTMRWNVVSHVALGLLTLALGCGLGALFGASGAVAGVALALGGASLITILGTCRDQGFPLRELLPPESLLLLAASVAAGLLALLVSRGLSARGTGSVLPVLLSALLVGTAVWRHPLRTALWLRASSANLRP